MRPRFGTGRVHDGFYAALFHSDAESGSLYAQIIECLTQVDSTKNRPIFLSGESQGRRPRSFLIGSPLKAQLCCRQ